MWRQYAETNEDNNPMPLSPNRTLCSPIHATRPLECVHTDIAGLITPTSREGHKFIINFVDVYTGMIFVEKWFMDTKVSKMCQRQHQNWYCRSILQNFYLSTAFKPINFDVEVGKYCSWPNTPSFWVGYWGEIPAPGSDPCKPVPVIIMAIQKVECIYLFYLISNIGIYSFWVGKQDLVNVPQVMKSIRRCQVIPIAITKFCF